MMTEGLGWTPLDELQSSYFMVPALDPYCDPVFDISVHGVEGDTWEVRAWCDRFGSFAAFEEARDFANTHLLRVADAILTHVPHCVPATASDPRALLHEVIRSGPPDWGEKG